MYKFILEKHLKNIIWHALGKNWLAYSLYTHIKRAFYFVKPKGQPENLWLDLNIVRKALPGNNSHPIRSGTSPISPEQSPFVYTTKALNLFKNDKQLVFTARNMAVFRLYKTLLKLHSFYQCSV